MNKKLLITGGAGFIGSAVIRHIIDNTNHSVVNVDKLTYAGNLESLTSIENNKWNKLFRELIRAIVIRAICNQCWEFKGALPCTY